MTLNGSVRVRGLGTCYWAGDSKMQISRMRVSGAVAATANRAKGPRCLSYTVISNGAIFSFNFYYFSVGIFRGSPPPRLL